MNVEDEISSILFSIGKDIKIHKVDSNNTIIEIDYEKYVKELLVVFNNFKQDFQ